MLNEQFRGDVHFVWCGDFFDSTKAAAYSRASMTPPSSDPCAIYRQLHREVKKLDRHSSKIQEQKLSLARLAAEWKEANELSADQAEEMIYIVNQGSIEDFSPLLYVIPGEKVAPRLQVVAANKRANLMSREYIIPDLKRHEFDIVEFDI